MHVIGDDLQYKKEKAEYHHVLKTKRKITFIESLHKKKYIFYASCAFCMLTLLVISSMITAVASVLLYARDNHSQAELIRVIIELATIKSSCSLHDSHISLNVHINENLTLNIEDQTENVQELVKQKKQKFKGKLRKSNGKYKDIKNVSNVTKILSENNSVKVRNYEVAPVIRIAYNFSEMMKTKGKYVTIGDPFLVFEGGYQMILSICPSGCNDGNGSHLSVYLHLMKGPHDDELEQGGRWPLSGVFKIELLNRFNLSDECHCVNHFPLDKSVCTNCTNRVQVDDKVAHGYGFDQFRLLSDLNSAIHDSLYFRISYKEYYSSIVAMELVSEALIILKLNIYNWVFVSVLLVFIEYTVFCANEIVQRPKIVNKEIGFGTVMRFLITSRPWCTGYSVLCRTVRNVLMIAVFIMTFFILLAAVEFVHPDFSTLADRSRVIIAVMQTGGKVVMLSMSVDIYKTSWGKNFPMVAPFWLLYLFPLSMLEVKSFIYQNFFGVCIIMCFCSELYKLVTMSTYTFSIKFVAFYLFIFIVFIALHEWIYNV